MRKGLDPFFARNTLGVWKAKSYLIPITEAPEPLGNLPISPQRVRLESIDIPGGKNH
jgi:hypothetical protein